MAVLSCWSSPISDARCSAERIMGRDFSIVSYIAKACCISADNFCFPATLTSFEVEDDCLRAALRSPLAGRIGGTASGPLGFREEQPNSTDSTLQDLQSQGTREVAYGQITAPKEVRRWRSG